MSALASTMSPAPVAATVMAGASAMDAPAEGSVPLDFQQLIGNLATPTIAELLVTATAARPEMVSSETLPGMAPLAGLPAVDRTAADDVPTGDETATDELNAALLALCNLQWPVQLPATGPRDPALPLPAADAESAAAVRPELAGILETAALQADAPVETVAVADAAVGAAGTRAASRDGALLPAAAATLAVSGEPAGLRAALEERRGDEKLPLALPGQLVAVRGAGADVANGAFVQLLHVTQAGERPAASAGGVAQRVIDVPVRHANWPEAVAAQVRWAASEQVQSATLKLTPEHLGPLEMRVEVRDNQINVNFGAAQAETRQALEQALPRLRDIMAGAGLSLGQASVQQEAGRASQFAAGHGHTAREEAADEAVATTRLALGLVDTYA